MAVSSISATLVAGLSGFLKAVAEAFLKYGFIFSKDLQALEMAMQSKDDFAIVVRCAAVMETALNEALALALDVVDNDLYAKTHIPWQDLVRLCGSSGMFDPVLVSALECYGRLRNIYAHKHEYHVLETSSEYKALYDAMKKVLRKLFNANLDDAIRETAQDCAVDLVSTLYILSGFLAGCLDLQLMGFKLRRTKVEA